MDFFGIADSELSAFGSGSTAIVLNPIGLPGNEAFGVPTLSSMRLHPVGLPGNEAFGVPSVTVQVLSAFESQLEQDLQDVFYNTDEFARNILYEYASGTQQQLDVIFDEESSSIDIATDTPVIVSEPMFHCASKDLLHTPGKGDRCRVKNRWFYIKEVHPDSTGVTVVTLRRD